MHALDIGTACEYSGDACNARALAGQWRCTDITADRSHHAGPGWRVNGALDSAGSAAGCDVHSRHAGAGGLVGLTVYGVRGNRVSQGRLVDNEKTWIAG